MQNNTDILTQVAHVNIGSVTIHAYGIIIGIAFIAGFARFLKKLPPSIKNDRQFPWLIASTLIGAIVGGRLGYVLGNTTVFKDNMVEIFRLWDGGITIFGVLTGGFLGYFASYTLLHCSTWLPTLLYLPDIASASILLGQSIGRWGNFINRELYGFPTRQSWGIYIPPEYRLPGYEKYDMFHPAFLYESILTFGGFLLISFLQRIYSKHLGKGIFFGLYLALYGSIRLGLERIRIETDPIIGPLKAADFAALACIVIGIILIKHGTGKK